MTTDRTNADRIARGQAAIDSDPGYFAKSDEELLTDILADLMHWGVSVGILDPLVTIGESIAPIIERAAMHVEAELSNDDF